MDRLLRRGLLPVLHHHHPIPPRPLCQHHLRFSTTPHPSASGPKPLPPLPVLHDSDIIESFLKGSGPGGQAINKTNSAVQLKHVPTGIVVKSQETRSRARNRSIARRLLQLKIEERILGDGARTRVKEEEKRRKKDRAKRRSRGKYARLREEKEGKVGEGAGEEVAAAAAGTAGDGGGSRGGKGDKDNDGGRHGGTETGDKGG